MIFTSIRTPEDQGYAAMASRMEALARQQPGYLGFDSAHGDINISVSYWRDLESIRLWKSNLEHLVAQQTGRERWYAHYSVRVCRIEYDYESAS